MTEANHTARHTPWKVIYTRAADRDDSIKYAKIVYAASAAAARAWFVKHEGNEQMSVDPYKAEG